MADMSEDLTPEWLDKERHVYARLAAGTSFRRPVLALQLFSRCRKSCLGVDQQ